ncbi:endonuclease V [Sporosarcina siberiensis]|uniref:Endonuclease V n=1 Tax=Sporosarcina siberiensis TaxID=1365606 RepID=A0ABW4SH77_9BACL
MKNKMIKEYTRIQNGLFAKVSLENNFKMEEILRIAGVDIAYWEEKGFHYGTCCIVVINFRTKIVIEQSTSNGEITVPYIPGFLAFRELPLVMEAVEKLTMDPDLYMFDGNGYLHYRHMGLATHASFYLNKPTIGVAKNYLKIENTPFVMPENETGAFTDIRIGQEIYGRVLRTAKDVKPIFVSSGNWIDLATSTEVVMACINENSRLPIPVRLADIETRLARRNLISK